MPADKKYRTKLYYITGSKGIVMTNEEYRAWFSASALQRATAYVAALKLNPESK